MGKKKSVTVGHRYFFSLHMGICRGPVDEIVEIKAGERTAWKGSVTGSSRIRIDAEELFGGKSGEGGIVGDLDIMMGEPGQAVHQGLLAHVRSMLGGLLPAFRGVVTAFFDGQIAAMNPYPKAWSWRVRRSLAGWDGGAFMPGSATIWLDDDQVRAMNPAHILYECATNRDWGRGYSASMINEASFRTAAEQLYNERFGLCLKWSRQDDLEQFAQGVLDHIGGVMYPDRSTGLLSLRLIRNDYDPETLPVYDYNSGLLAVEEWVSTALNDAPNEIVVKWVSPIDNETRSLRAQSLAGRQASGSVISETRDYPGVPTAELGNRVAQRDLRAAASSLKRGRLRLDRRAWQVNPGDVIRVTIPDRGVANVVVRIITIDDGTPTAGDIVVTCVQDVFSLPETAYGGIEPPRWTEPDTEATVPVRRVYEWPYGDLVESFPAGEFAQIADDGGYFGEAAMRPSPMAMGYDLAMRAEGEPDWQVRGRGDWAPTLRLTAKLGRLDAEVAIAEGTDVDRIEIGRAALIDDEIVRIVAVSSSRLQIARGCFDTIPAEHAAGTIVWCYQDDIGTDTREYAAGETVYARTLTRTTRKTLALELAETDELTMNWRFLRPYPPGAVLINDSRWWATTRLAYPVDRARIRWAHRDRPGQVEKLLEHDTGHIGPEPGVQYVLRVYDTPLTELSLAEGNIAPPPGYDPAAEGLPLIREAVVTAPEWTYLRTLAGADIAAHLVAIGMPIEARRLALGKPRSLTLTLTARRDGIESWQWYRMPLTYVPAWARVTQVVRQRARPLYIPHPLERWVYEQPYREVIAHTPSPDAADAWLGIAVAPVPMPQVIDYAIASAAGSESPAEISAYGDWVPHAALAGAVETLAAEIALSGTLDIEAGDVIAIDAEILVVIAIDGSALTVGRGCLDTIPAAHQEGAAVWAYAKNIGNDGKLWGAGDALSVRTISHAPPAPLLINRYPVDALQMRRRVPRPYPPGGVTLNGAPWFKQVTPSPGNDVVIAWTHRDRLAQARAVVDHYQPHIGPEPGVQYVLRVVGQRPVRLTSGATKWESVNLVTRTFSGDVDTWTYSWADLLADAAAVRAREDANRAYISPGRPPLSSCRPIAVTLELLSERDGLESWQWYRMTVVRTALEGCSPDEPPYVPPGWPGSGGGTGGDDGGTGGGGAPGDGQGPPASGGEDGDSSGQPGGPGQPTAPDPDEPDEPGEPGEPTDPGEPADPGVPDEPPVGVQVTLVSRVVARSWVPPHGPGWGNAWSQWWNGGLPFEQLGDDDA